jgi:MFS family permease
VGRRPFYGWYIAASSFATLAFTVGIPLYGMPFYYDYFIRDFGWSRGATTGGMAFATILVLPIAGFFVHRFSARKLIIFGVVVWVLALNGFGRMGGSLVVYYALWCVVQTAYVYAGPIPNQVILSQWFRRNRGTAMGLAYLGLGVGGAVSQRFVALPLIQRFGWPTALQITGLLTLVLLPLLLFVVRDRPSEKGLHPDGDPTEPAEARVAPLELSHLIRQRHFWFLAVGSFCSMGAIGSITQHLKLLFLDKGLSEVTVANTTMLLLIFSNLGRIGMGWLADRLPKKYVMIAAYLLVALPLPLLFVADRPYVPWIFAMIYGFGLGADFMMIPLMAAELFGANSLARVMGVLLPVDSIGLTVFPFVLGVMHDQLGNYNVGLLMISALGLVGAAAIATLPRSGPLRLAAAAEASA